ncbi:uncharacterized protein PHALS_15155 [Plasmopara halstedii]|uniref:Uncharacterized protein n=1 Tax=Plasmopara halstedii TaxID=4781 RepID=A0A0P1B4H2_PLAHL|nr:uncharacterized protein PHALS_15155 [Plasmopara halstedii]CEG48520.1 hypothetical protein PHALS_15155 [Plasmopara halstedii]|eukprot:XP_024584889.1 hypothetical protein PHALS_15155 [Plasmopara halstedii]
MPICMQTQALKNTIDCTGRKARALPASSQGSIYTINVSNVRRLFCPQLSGHPFIEEVNDHSTALINSNSLAFTILLANIKTII